MIPLTDRPRAPSFPAMTTRTHRFSRYYTLLP